jgi:hypothetical protein
MVSLWFMSAPLAFKIKPEAIEVEYTTGVVWEE